MFSEDPVLDEEGKPLTDEAGEPTGETTTNPMLLGNIMINALMGDMDTSESDEEVEATKEHRFDLSKLIFEAMEKEGDSSEIALSKADVKMIKARIEAGYSTIVAGAAMSVMS